MRFTSTILPKANPSMVHIRLGESLSSESLPPLLTYFLSLLQSRPPLPFRPFPHDLAVDFAPLTVGLSPRARGNPRRHETGKAGDGSIPACAGEPARARATCALAGVYPRVRGGTAAGTAIGDGGPGLSPRARGNLHDPAADVPQIGSIPACAGEPARSCRRCAADRVYPRVRGGTLTSRFSGTTIAGLSPRARGNLRNADGRNGASGSIPACAGEPRAGRVRDYGRRVYPRVRGGTTLAAHYKDAAGGLSPRARGNPEPPHPHKRGTGSIPACAGEPGRESGRCRFPRVYPRVRGGTAGVVSVSTRAQGLSPRARGNPIPALHEFHAEGSIPACAGEPLRKRSEAPFRRVYPRVRGGTHSTPSSPSIV